MKNKLKKFLTSREGKHVLGKCNCTLEVESVDSLIAQSIFERKYS